MQHNDKQYGKPAGLFTDTKANIEALTGTVEGAIAYATDTNEQGTYNGSTWDWVDMASAAGHTLQDEGTPFTQRPNLNFVGTGVTLEDDPTNNATKVAIPGGGAGGGATVYRTAYGSPPGTDAAGDLWLPTDSPYIFRRNDADTAWEPWGTIHRMTLPDDTGFSWVNQGGASISTAQGGITMTLPVTSTVMRGRVKTAPATPWTIRAAFMCNLAFGNFSGPALILRESSTGKLVVCTYHFNAGVVQVSINNWSSPTAYVSSPVSNTAVCPSGWPVFLRLQDDGTNITYSIAVAGHSGNYVTVGTVGRTSYLTSGPNEVGWGGRSEGSGNSYLTLLSWEQA